MALRDPVKLASVNFKNSSQATALMQYAIETGNRLNVFDHNDDVIRVLKNAKSMQVMKDEVQSEAVIDDLPNSQKRVIKRVVDGKASSWLSVLPIARDGYDLTAEQFRDKLAERYGREPLSLPKECDGCGAPFSLQHGLDCMKGGLVKKGHDQLRDQCIALADLAWGGVIVEPLVKEQTGRLKEDLRADFSVRGVWDEQKVAYFDNRISNADAPSRLARNISWKTTLNAAAKEKKNKYKNACEDIRASFTPLVCTTDGCFHREFEAFTKRLAHRLSSKWNKTYSEVMGWVRVKLQFAIIRAVDLRLRGSRKRFRRMGLEDGAGILWIRG
mmetsp:Transcript_18461/g.23887  ORF Transcript_18461/g.23887 Transcript_18461/m.23887 type:complete len:329 (-) Transcript_18461:131-1117(-)